VKKKYLKSLHIYFFIKKKYSTYNEPLEPLASKKSTGRWFFLLVTIDQDLTIMWTITMLLNQFFF
jgi:hypothetical protein